MKKILLGIIGLTVGACQTTPYTSDGWATLENPIRVGRLTTITASKIDVQNKDYLFLIEGVPDQNMKVFKDANWLGSYVHDVIKPLDPIVCNDPKARLKMDTGWDYKFLVISKSKRSQKPYIVKINPNNCPD